jgi:hypothetical protein
MMIHAGWGRVVYKVGEVMQVWVGRDGSLTA